MNGLPQFGLNPFLTYPPPSTAFSIFPSGMFTTPYPFLFPLPPIDTSKMLATWEQLKFNSFFDEQPLDLSMDRRRSDGDNLENEYIDVTGIDDENGEYPLNLTMTSTVVRPTAVYVQNFELPGGTLLSPPNQQQGTLFKDNLHPSGPFKCVRNNEMVKQEVKSSIEDTPPDQEIGTTKKFDGSSKTTENKHYCKICDKGFAKAANLKRHLKIHTTGQTSLKCPSCERQFSTSFRLLRHIKSQHKVNVELPEKK
ncbi:uncharacterized protein [Rhodnius prolixus]|uniref:C2H2-type domain-containing protein n=1 Tax=Rhodnius prolixus TaxID=13249 RepID=T1I6G2_RHOPR